MSAYNRLPEDYRKRCAHYAERMGKFVGTPPRPTRISPQNRRVRFAVDSGLAALKCFPNTETRQQRRASERPWKKRLT